MNDEDRRFLSSWDDQLTPTLKDNYELVKALNRVPICVACPMAQWYRKEDAKGGAELECFCTAYRRVMFDGGRVVTACDARVDALKPPRGEQDDGEEVSRLGPAPQGPGT